MPGPIETTYAGVKILIHEAGCTCNMNHAAGFGPDNKTVILSTYDDDAEAGFFQVWYRIGKWGLHEAMEMLLERSKNRDRIA